MTRIVGRYDKECQETLNRLEAEGVLLLVLCKKRGHGFSASFKPEWAETFAHGIPDMLRDVARKIEEDLEKRKLN